MQRAPFEINGVKVEAGKRATVDLAVAQLYTHTPLNIPVQIVHGRQDGPVLLVCAAIHGDELNGVEIIRRLLKLKVMSQLKGTLVAVPIVNVFGFIQRSRYLPDRRDLNRCFPGIKKGSLGARIANLFCESVVRKCTHVVDLHTGAVHRSNLPQVWGAMNSSGSNEMARAFGTPVVLDATLPDGSLRSFAESINIPVITYEAGEALRFNELSIYAGIRGIINVMRMLGMLRSHKSKKKSNRSPVIANQSQWVRAETDGVFRPLVELGASVKKHQPLATISAPFGDAELTVLAPASGIVIARTNIPLVNEGEALFHVALYEKVSEIARHVEVFQSELFDDELIFADDMEEESY
ncbi:succinylglutamate desuccinylase/aspartoacylase family protein [Zooshikella harenae]|uniref:Succinylglutamate desuccinylase/aspartoacylase family protein n=1 Tax=Zooshikella harenae TaxID=2827238 RepID=A0ABS5Z5U9_9GAMM|nr:succinylglutamate desuccinylase/aspartoacylase family protein [Zooshikella harenae]MBU2709444.1 succinylglutamate desuccinylase/aspartoacylase family protein [Zooshikella harenae]